MRLELTPQSYEKTMINFSKECTSKLVNFFFLWICNLDQPCSSNSEYSPDRHLRTLLTAQSEQHGTVMPCFVEQHSNIPTQKLHTNYVIISEKIYTQLFPKAWLACFWLLELLLYSMKDLGSNLFAYSPGFTQSSPVSSNISKPRLDQLAPVCLPAQGIFQLLTWTQWSTPAKNLILGIRIHVLELLLDFVLVKYIEHIPTNQNQECGSASVKLCVHFLYSLHSLHIHPFSVAQSWRFKKCLEWLTALYLCCLRGKGQGMTPAKIEINERNRATVSSRRSHINLLRLLKINDAKAKHLDNELYNDGLVGWGLSRKAEEFPAETLTSVEDVCVRAGIIRNEFIYFFIHKQVA